MTEKFKILRLRVVEASGLCPRWGQGYGSATCHSTTGVALANPMKGSL
jgi:hypothetical protein